MRYREQSGDLHLVRQRHLRAWCRVETFC